MDLDIAQTAAAVMPFLVATAQAYGQGTLAKIRDTAVDEATTATVNWGSELLRRLLDRAKNRSQLESSIESVAGSPDTIDVVEALHLQVRDALVDNRSLHQEVTEILAAAQRDLNIRQISDKNTITQNSISLGNSKQAVQGSGVQNINFGS